MVRELERSDFRCRGFPIHGSVGWKPTGKNHRLPADDRGPMKKRTAEIEKPISVCNVVEILRNTTETQIKASLNIKGSGRFKVDTGIGFFDHMLELFAKHGGF